MIFLRLFYICWTASCLAGSLSGASAENGRKKTIVLIGPSGVGKSTLGNCLLNNDPSINLTRNFPFMTNNSANGCTANSVSASNNNNLLIIDTVGFGDPSISSQDSFLRFKEALDAVNYTIDVVMFVLVEGRLEREIIDFFKVFQDEVLQKRLAKNSILVCSKCNKGWLASNRMRSPCLNELIERCNNRSFEFKLSFDEIVDENENSTSLAQADIDKWSQIVERSRNASIHELVKYVEAFNPTPVDVTYIKSKKFEKLFVGKIAPRIQKLSAAIGRADTALRNFKEWVEKNGAGIVLGSALVSMPFLGAVGAGSSVAAGGLALEAEAILAASAATAAAAASSAGNAAALAAAESLVMSQAVGVTGIVAGIVGLSKLIKPAHVRHIVGFLAKLRFG